MHDGCNAGDGQEHGHPSESGPPSKTVCGHQAADADRGFDPYVTRRTCQRHPTLPLDEVDESGR